MSSSSTDNDDNDANVQMWRMKKQIEALERARGNGTSMISLIIPPKDQISRVNKMLGDEYGTASNIKSRVNRLSVLSAITSAQQKLKLFSRVPDNGLCIFCGEIVTEDGKEKKLCLAVEPIKTINTSLYMCDNRFHTEALRELLENDKKFGFIVMDGSGSLFGTLSGSQREVLHRITVDLPKKHGRGGQSALRFARLRLEKRHNYVRKIAELAVQHFITNDRPNVAGLILAGLADFKTELSASDLFDPRLQAVIIKIVDVSYGGENGFNQAIEQSAEILQNVKFLEEKKIIGQFFEHIALDTGRYCFGIEDTLKALVDMQAIERLIVYEGIEHVHYRLKHPETGEEREVTFSKEEAEKREAASFVDQATGDKLEVVESMTMLEWLATNYKRFGARLDFVTDKSQEGSQFVKGFGGIGGILRYKVDFANLDADAAGDDSDDDPDGDFI